MTFAKRPVVEDGPQERDGDVDPASRPGAVTMVAATRVQEPPREQRPAGSTPAVDIVHTAEQLRQTATTLAAEGRTLTAVKKDFTTKPDPHSDPNPLAESVAQKSAGALAPSTGPESARPMLIDAAKELGELARSMSIAAGEMRSDADVLDGARRLNRELTRDRRVQDLGVEDPQLPGMIRPGGPYPRNPKLAKQLAWEAQGQAQQLFILALRLAEPLTPEVAKYTSAVRHAAWAAEADKVAADPAKAQAALLETYSKLDELSGYLGNAAEVLKTNYLPLGELSDKARNLAAHHRHLLGDPDAPNLAPLDPPFPPEAVGTPWGPPGTPGTVAEMMYTALRHTSEVERVLTDIGPLAPFVSPGGVMSNADSIKSGARSAIEQAAPVLVPAVPTHVGSMILDVGTRLRSLGYSGILEGKERAAWSARLDAAATAAGASADLAAARAAVARDAAPPEVMPEHAPVGEDHSVGTVAGAVVEQASSFAGSKDLVSRIRHRDLERDAVDGLVKGIEQNVAAAETYAAQNEPEKARDAMNVAIGQFRQLSRIGAQAADQIRQEGERAGAAGEAARAYAQDVILDTVIPPPTREPVPGSTPLERPGTEVPEPTPATPPGTRPERGSQPAPGGPGPDGPVQDAGTGEPDRTISVAGVEGGGLPVASSEPAATVAATTPAPGSGSEHVASTDTESTGGGDASSPFDNGALLADLDPAGDTFADNAFASTG